MKVFPISSTLYDPYKHFLISASSPDFAATGLLKESYVQEVVAELDVADIGHRLGELTGEILEDFRRWSWF